MARSPDGPMIRRPDDPIFLLYFSRLPRVSCPRTGFRLVMIRNSVDKTGRRCLQYPRMACLLHHRHHHHHRAKVPAEARNG